MKQKEIVRPAPAPVLDLQNVVDLYIRVSTTEQAEEGYSVGEQEKRLRSYCEAYGFIINAVHIDPGYSGATLDRPGIKQIIKDVRAGACKKVIVWKLDRLSRSQKDTLILLEDVFLANGCNFVSIMESFDTSTPFGRCIVGILAAFAQMERENIKARTMMGKQAGLKAGNFYAPKAPCGYVFGRDSSGAKVLKVDPFWSQMVKELYSRLDAGEALGSIADLFKKKYGFGGKYRNDNASELSRKARNRTYCGQVLYGGKVYEGKHEPLVSVELWERVNGRLAENNKAFKRMYGASDGLLSGLLFCGCCGARMSIRQWGWKGEKVNKYVCYSVSKCNKHMIKDPNCSNRKNNFVVSDLDDLVLNEIKKLSIDRSVFDSVVAESRGEAAPDLDVFRERLEDVNRQINRLLNLFQSGVVELEEIQDRLASLKEERRAVAESIEKLEEQSAEALPAASAWDSLCSLQAVIDGGDREALYALIHSLIKKIEVNNGDVSIYWAFC